MITTNYKNMLAPMLQTVPSASSYFGMFRLRDKLGAIFYQNPLYGSTNFPTNSQNAGTFTTAVNSTGISVGSGGTEPTEEDYALENPITSGITGTVTATKIGCESPGKSFIEYSITITNTSGAQMTIREIGYTQPTQGTTRPGQTVSQNQALRYVLLDRTVLDEPLVLEAGDAGIITYKLMTQAYPTKVVEGVEIVPFTWGTDEQIAAMIAAAHDGKIDLQADGGWRVGDGRLISVGAWTGGGSAAHAAQDILAVISSFEDYNGCGCVMQLDFAEVFADSQRYNATNTNVGGYGESEMYTTSLPALAAAFPAWLRTLMKTFTVLASAGNKSTEIVSVPNNLLALRSEVEVFGAVTYSAPGEGEQIKYYRDIANATIKTNGMGETSSYRKYWWLRSPATNYATSACYVKTDGTAGYATAGGAGTCVSPFCCV